MGFLIRVKNGLSRVWNAVRQWRKKLNDRMHDHYKPTILALIVCGAIVLLSAIMLFIPPYLGYSDDGSFAAVLQDTGLARVDESDYETYFNYYERQYKIEESAYKPSTTPLAQRLLVSAAIRLDTLFTRDRLFDLRWLALLYLLLYAAALYSTVLFALERTKYFSEGMLIGVFAVLIFGDASYITRFASFYTQPLLLICVVSLIGHVFWAIRSKRAYAPLILLLLTTLVMSTINAFCGLAAMIFAGLCLALSSLRSGFTWKTTCIVFAVIICIAGIRSATVLAQQQTDDDKYHAMTRGVLQQSSNPVETLAEFDIASRYSLLADTYANQVFPLAHSNEDIVLNGFLDQYSTGDIFAHYVIHPTSLMSMLDLSVKNSFLTRPDYSGNYERSAGLPARAKTPFMSIWSTFKSQSVPSTIGFFLLVVLAVLILFRRGKKMRIKRAGPETLAVAIWATMLALAVFAVLEIILVILYSGDALMLREAFVFSVCFDLLFLFAISEILNRLDIIRDKQ